MTLKLAIRGFVNGKCLFEHRVALPDNEIERLQILASQHAEEMAAYPLHMIEIEFLDEPDVNQRFFRFGTDPSMMVQPGRLG